MTMLVTSWGERPGPLSVGPGETDEVSRAGLAAEATDGFLLAQGALVERELRADQEGCAETADQADALDA
ncbi:MAG TPA: hypothetical protein VGJ60_07090 [Chloroflexota bacterium]|jgi:hypothetical protein